MLDRPLRWREIIHHSVRQMSDVSLPPSPPAEKATARQDQAREASTGDGAGDCC